MTLTEQQKQGIEQEAEDRYPYLKGLVGSAMNETLRSARSGYIAGATAHAIACIQKDEEIGRLTDKNEKLIEQLKAIQKHCRDAGVPKFKEDWILIEINKITTEALKQ